MMLTKNEYIIMALNAGMANNVQWVSDLVSITGSKTPGDYLLYKEEGEWCFNVGDEIHIIEDYDGGVIATISDFIEIKAKDVLNLDMDTTTRIGILLANYVLLIEVFGKTIPYINGEIHVREIEAIIADKLKDNDYVKDTGEIYVRDKLYFTDQVAYLRSLSLLFTVAATPKNIVPAEGINAARKELLKKYEGKLDDPVQQAEFEKEMKQVDEQWLKDDPSQGHLIQGKMETARLKMYGSFGSSTGFDGETTPHIPTSIDEGLPDDNASITGLINSLRAGSFSRSKLTMIGGMTANIINRAMSPVTITSQNCNTKNLKTVMFQEGDDKRYVGLYAKKKNGLVKSLEASEIIPGKTMEIRTPLYCKEPGASICMTCAGDKLSERKKGLMLAVSHVNSRILYYYMKLFHVTVHTNKKLDFIDRIS